MRTSFAVILTGALCCASCSNNTQDSVDVGTLQQGLVGDAIAGLTPEQQAAFADGAEAFAEVETIEDGLGPIFNDKSCGACHSVGGLGGSGTQFEHRAGSLVGGVFNSLSDAGGQLFDRFSVMNLTGNERRNVPNCQLQKNGEQVPANANVQALRRTTALFGLGLVDNTPESAFQTIAAAQATNIRGRLNQVHVIPEGTAMGKFGWKAQVPTLFQFSGDAYLNEMGITNPVFPTEQAPFGNFDLIAPCDLVPGLEDDGDDVQAFTDFMQLLAPVAPLASTTQTQAGDTVFTQIGCDGCHTRSITSGSGSSIAALNNQTYHPFSDFLLHDMGSLGDNIGDNGIATPTEMRTAPLWGLRLVDAKHQLLHDGSATSLQDAIARHDGQGATARNAFNALSTTDRNNLLAFLKSL